MTIAAKPVRGVIHASAMLALLGCTSAALGAEREGRTEIRYTAYGIPHVVADSYAGAGMGYGWALARDNLCAVVERAVTLAGERSRTIGADQSYYDAFARGQISNFDSDAVYQYIFPASLTGRLKRDAGPELRDLVRGYVAGFNRRLAAAAQEGEDCRAQSWFRPITEDDIWRRIAHVPLLEASALLLREMVAAAPPSDGAAVRGPGDTLARLAETRATRGGSNAAAFGRDGVAGGSGGLSFANPHYAWHGTERLHVFHLTVRGKLDVFGATPYGLPFPMLGFTRNVGWGITHSTDKRATIYELALDPADPTRYRIDGRSEPMRPVEVSVRTDKGVRKRTFWESRYGPLVTGGKLPWDRGRAYALADPERTNLRFADQFLAIARARNVREIRNQLEARLGSPWSNVTAADAGGEVLYANISVAANITDAQLASCVVTSAARFYMEEADFTALDGSRSACAWTRSPGAADSGIIPGRRRPAMIRTDAVFNANDSHWFSTPAVEGVLENYPRVIGPERTAQGERTRIAALYMRQAMAGEAGGVRGATPAIWERLFFSARNLNAELLLDDLVADCVAHPVATMPDGQRVDLAAACEVLRKWDRKDLVTSRGSALFAEFLRGLEVVPKTGFTLAPKYWRVPFDVKDPVMTPRGLAASEETRRALARAINVFKSLGIPIDAPLGDVQSVTRNGRRLPLSGSAVTYHMVRPLTVTHGQGITEIRTGDSYIHLVSITRGGVKGRFLLTYSQSTNPHSPHYSDMTELFSKQTFADVAFTPQQVRAGQVGETVVLEPIAR